MTLASEQTAAPRTSPPTPLACATCGAALHGRYCHDCGERVVEPGEFRLSAFLARATGAVFNLDSRLYNSLRLLLLRPGELTAAYMAGRRRRYLSPLQLFLVANLVFFAVLTLLGGASTFTTELRFHTNQAGYGHIAQDLIARLGPAGSPERAAFEERFNDAVPRFANSMVIVLAPVLAGMLAILLVWRRRPFVQHLVFALHFLTFLLLVLTALPLLLRGLVALLPAALPVLDAEIVLSTVLLVIFGVYLARAIRRAYDVAPAAAGVIGFTVSLLLLPALVVYRMILFFTVWLAV